jgi:phospholipid/cholesterol/gamma-HCH transport system ATP-binding protein
VEPITRGQEASLRVGDGPGGSVIRLHGISKAFDRQVLSGIDLHVPEGVLTGLIGPGASGKSLVLKTICGLLIPDGGEVNVGGRDVLAMDALELGEYRKGIGMVFQNNALFDFMTVGDNVAFPLRRLFDLDESEIEHRVSERLERVGLAGFENRYPTGLSGGQKKRVAVARATVTSAPIVLYDEPAAGLDPVTSQRIFDLLRDEQQRARSTVIMVSSDIDRLLTVTDRVGLMHQGELLFEGTTGEAFESNDPIVRQFLRGEVEGPL